jgi:DNA-binding winged helix-turn-helix (wHTH) protein
VRILPELSADLPVFCRVLGPLEIEFDEVVVDLGGGLPRRPLAALLLGQGRPVSDHELTDLLWGDVPPADPNALRVVISRTRSALGPALRQCLQRTLAGYRLTVSVEQTDHSQFSVLVTDGTSRLADHDPHAAVHVCRSPTTRRNNAPPRGRAAGDVHQHPQTVGTQEGHPAQIEHHTFARAIRQRGDERGQHSRNSRGVDITTRGDNDGVVVHAGAHSS